MSQEVLQEAGQQSAPAGQDGVLEIDGLRTYFESEDATIRAVDGISLSLKRGETLGLVGESGCGKSVTALSVMRLLRQPPARIVAGSVRLEGRDLLALSEEAMRDVRGNEISMIFQEPMTSLNPVLTVGRQVAETFTVHQAVPWREALERAEDILRVVRIPDPKRRLKEFPHQLSGGMRQRVMIAMALACRPKVLIADEPTTALDVTIQAQILHLMAELKEHVGASVLLITHDLGVVANTAQRVAVMYAGRKVEEAPVRELFRRPMHPYTVGLMGSIPRLRDAASAGRRRRLREIPGTVPALSEEIVGCAFAPRCPLATDRCRAERPPLEAKAAGHLAACWESERVGTL